MTEGRALHLPRESLRKAKRIVLKVGTSILTSRQGGFSKQAFNRLGQQVLFLSRQKREVVLVSSGAIAFGMETLRLKNRPEQLKKLQACAAIGQGKLMRSYEEFFSRRSIHTAQVLLTREALETRERFLNAKHTLDELFSLKVLPIVNENDTVATEEIAFGDNDLLSVWVASLVRADLLIILSDVDGFFLKDGSRIRVVEGLSQIEKNLVPHLADQKKERSVGGMRAKLAAARLAMQSGIPLLLVNGHREKILEEVFSGADVGTLFVAGGRRSSRENWIAFSAPKRGSIQVDPGAYEALAKGRKSLLPRGIIGHEGRFGRGEVVELCSGDQVFGRGLVRYSSEELSKIAGKKTHEIEAFLGYKYNDEVIHRNDLVLWA